MKKSALLLLPLLALSFHAFAASPSAPKKDVDFAEYYLKEFEAEVTPTLCSGIKMRH